MPARPLMCASRAEKPREPAVQCSLDSSMGSTFVGHFRMLDPLSFPNTEILRSNLQIHSARGVGDEGRFDLSGSLVIAKLPLRLEPILHGTSFEVALLLIKFIGSLRDLRPHIGTLRSQ